MIGQGASAVSVTGTAQTNYVLVATSNTTATWQQDITYSNGTVTTTSNTPQVLLTIPLLSDNTSYYITAYIVGKQTSSPTSGSGSGNTLGLTFGCTLNASYKRLTGASSIVQIQNDVKTVIKDSGVNWSVSSSANTTTGGINLNVTGSPTSTVLWNVNCQYVYI